MSVSDLSFASYASFYKNFNLSSPLTKPVDNEEDREKFNSFLRYTKMYINRGSGVDQNFGNTSVQNDKQQV